jgi:hypothetical protein
LFGGSRKLESTGETLVSLRIVIFKSGLEFNGLDEISLLAGNLDLTLGVFLTLGVSNDPLDACSK